MALEQIIIVDEDGSKYTIKSSPEPYESVQVVDGEVRVEVGVSEPLSSVLRRVIEQEWRKVRRIGARLVTKIVRAR